MVIPNGSGPKSGCDQSKCQVGVSVLMPGAPSRGSCRARSGSSGATCRAPRRVDLHAVVRACQSYCGPRHRKPWIPVQQRTCTPLRHRPAGAGLSPRPLVNRLGMAGHATLHLVAARANDHDSPLLGPTLTGIVEMIGPLPQHRGTRGAEVFPTLHLDRGYDSARTRDLLHVLGFHGEIAGLGPACAGSGRTPVAGRAHALVDERLRQAASVHRPQDRRRVLPHPRCRADRTLPLDQQGPHDSSVADPAHHPPPPLTIIRRALLAESFVDALTPSWSCSPGRERRSAGREVFERYVRSLPRRGLV